MLGPTSLGPLALGKTATISEQQLKKLFPSYTVKYSIGQGDSPDFHHFEVTTSKGELLFTIRSFIEKPKESKKTDAEVPIQLLRIHSPGIPDIHGLRTGNRVQDILAKRGQALEFGASHDGVYLGGAQIYYNIKKPADVSPDRLARGAAVKGNWQARSLSWPGPSWD